MPPRFYCPSFTAAGLTTLDEAEAHHLARVLRLSAGEAVELFNGRGDAGQGVIAAIRKRNVDVRIETVLHEPAPSPRLHLATAVPKGERFDWLIEKATELGVARLIPLQTQRGAVEPRDSKLERLRQSIVTACKQCGRNHLMELASPAPFGEFVKSVPARLIVAHPSGRPLPLADWGEISDEQAAIPTEASQTPTQPPNTWTACIGPEGGFTEEEIHLAEQHGGQLVNLGRRLLRIETAGIAVAAWMMLRGEARTIEAFAE